MKTKIKYLLAGLTMVFLASNMYSQDVDRYYKENVGEFIFSYADLEENGDPVPTTTRFSMFFHLGRKHHINFNRFMGIYTGYGLRNIGFIYKQNNIKTKRRTYSLGIPLALKLGVIDKDFFIYGGASYELFFHYKQKQFIDGEKSKFSEWFSPRTERFGHSLFTGVRFPGGWDLKFKYYPGDFLNHDFTGNEFGEEVDYSRYTRSNLFYIGISYNFRPDKFFSMPQPKPRQTNYAALKK